MQRPQLIAIGTGLLLATATFAWAASVTLVTYTGPNNGSWGDPLNWSPNVIPDQEFNGPTDPDYCVSIPATRVILNYGGTFSPPTNVDEVVIAAGGELFIPNAQYFRVNIELLNDGQITLMGDNVAQNRSQLHLEDDGTLTGTGVLTLASTDALLGTDGAGSGSLIFNHDAGHTIEGFGQFGAATSVLMNAGLIDANASGETLFATLRAGPTNVNTGTMQASNGGRLSLGNGNVQTLDNTAGQIIADLGSFIELDNFRIVGGTVSTIGNGEIHCSTRQGIFTDLTFDGICRILGGVNPTLELEGSIVNNGIILLDSTGGGQSSLRIGGPVVNLTGSGEIVLAGGNDDEVDPFGAGSLLVQGANHTLRGGGRVDIAFENAGTFRADNPAVPLDMNPEQLPLINTGLIEATNGATLDFAGFLNLDNTGGVFHADDASIVLLTISGNQSLITGGTFETTGTGEIHINSQIRCLDITNNGVMRVLEPSGFQGFRPQGTFTNNGTILSSEPTATLLWVEADTNFTGTGEIIFSDDPGHNIAAFNNLDWDITHDTDHTIRGPVRFGPCQSVTNHGTLIVEGTNVTQIGQMETFSNTGTIEVMPGALLRSFQAIDNPLLNSGSVTVHVGGRFEVDDNDNYVQSGAQSFTTVNGVMEIHNMARAEIIGGDLTGSGLIDGEVLVQSAEVRPGNSTGTLTIDDDCDFSFSSTLYTEIGGSAPGEFDVLAVTGTADLAAQSPGSHIVVDFINGYAPAAGTRFEVLTAGAVVGTFTSVTVLNAPTDVKINVLYTPTRVIVEASSPSVITGINATLGTIMEGGEADLVASDDSYVNVRSTFGFSASAANIVDLDVTLVTADTNATDMRITAETRIDHPGATGKWFVKDQTTSLWTPLHEFALPQTDALEALEFSNANPFIRASDGRIDVRLRSSTIAVFTPLGFHVRHDLLKVDVW